jgi:hypothetical protein
MVRPTIESAESHMIALLSLLYSIYSSIYKYIYIYEDVIRFYDMIRRLIMSIVYMNLLLLLFH